MRLPLFVVLLSAFLISPVYAKDPPEEEREVEVTGGTNGFNQQANEPVVTAPAPGSTGGTGNSDGDTSSRRDDRVVVTPPKDQQRKPAPVATTPAPVQNPIASHPTTNVPTTGGKPVGGPQQPATEPERNDPPELASAKNEAWKAIDAGDNAQARQILQDAMKLHPDDEQLRQLAKLTEKHDSKVDGASLAKRLAGLGTLREAGNMGDAKNGAQQQLAAAQPQGWAQPQLASPIGLIAAAAPRAPAGVAKGTFLKMSMKDYTGAEADLTARIGADPLDWLAYRWRALTRRYLKKLPEAESDANEALRLNPKDSASHGVKALIRLDAGDPKGAYDEATQALSLNAKDADAHVTRAQALDALDRRDEALADYKSAAELDAQFNGLYRRALLERSGLPKLTQARTLYLAAAGLALLFWGFTFFVKRSGDTARRQIAAMRAEDRHDTVGGYRVLRRLGQGGMGIVFEAFDEQLHRRVALKRMREEIANDPRERRRFIKEARLVASLRHPNIVEIFTLVEESDALYLVFEYLPGKTLDEVVEKSGGRLAPAQLLPLARQIAEALDFAHSHGVVHQDLKPSNILVADGRAKVMDFGIARRVQETLSTLSRAEAIGTPSYMSPEQEQGIVTPKADVFALGVCLYELLSGKRPYANGDAGAFAKAEQRFRPLSEVSGLPATVDAPIAAALHPDAAKRPASAVALVAALEAALAPARA